jgi:hypothetical protein
VTIATDSSGRLRTPTDGLSQARDAAALAVRVCTWLRDEEAIQETYNVQAGGACLFTSTPAEYATPAHKGTVMSDQFSDADHERARRAGEVAMARLPGKPTRSASTPKGTTVKFRALGVRVRAGEVMGSRLSGAPMRLAGDPATSPCPLRCRRANADTPGNWQGLRTSLARSHQAASCVRWPTLADNRCATWRGAIAGIRTAAAAVPCIASCTRFRL